MDEPAELAAPTSTCVPDSHPPHTSLFQTARPWPEEAMGRAIQFLRHHPCLKSQRWKVIRLVGGCGTQAKIHYLPVRRSLAGQPASDSTHWGRLHGTHSVPHCSPTVWTLGQSKEILRTKKQKNTP